MSGDLFAELNEDSASENPQSDNDTPIEFSGVSAGPSPPKLLPLAQPLAQTTTRTTATASKDELIFCKFCKKTYKTWRNFEKHMMTKHPGQKVEAGQPPSELSAASSSKTSDSVSFLCQKCSKSVKSSAALIRHMAGHKVQELNQKKPEPAEFLIVQGDVTRKIIEEMLKEPNYGERSKLKIEFLEALLTCESLEWLDLVNELSIFICSVACDRESKQLPINQYEKSQAKLNTYLNDATLYDRLTETLVSLAPQEISTELAGRLLSRFAFKLMDEVQNWVANTLRQNEVEIFEHEEFNMSPVEEKAFIINLGNIFRAFFKKGLHSSSGQLQSQSACLKDTFILGRKPVSSLSYLNKKNWSSGEQNSIVPSDNAITFFKSVEKICRTSAATSLPTAQDVIQKILLCIDTLNVWYFLTNDYFSEEGSFLFMRDILLTYVSSSTRQETQKINRMREKDVRATTVALRPSLNTNFIDKTDDCVEKVG